MTVLLMDSLEDVFRSEHHRLWKSLLAFTGDADITAEAEAETFSQALGRGDQLTDPKAWVWRTAFKIASGLLAERRQASSHPGSGAPGTIPTSGDIQVDQSLLEFVDLLGTLSEQQRTVVVLRYAGGLMPSEIAEVAGTSPGTVRVQLHRAHSHLRQKMTSR